jgi:hypothetical protein
MKALELFSKGGDAQKIFFAERVHRLRNLTSTTEAESVDKGLKAHQNKSW